MTPTRRDLQEVVAGAFSRIRLALLVGFALVFGLWLGSTYYFLQRLAEIKTLSGRIYAEHDREQELLLTVRARVLLASIYIRDALATTDRATFARVRQELNDIRSDIDAALREYLPSVDSPAEREQWPRLEAGLRDYWETMLPVLTLDARRAPVVPDMFVRTAVVPKRDLVLEISERIRALNQQAFLQEQQRLDETHSGVARRVWAMSSLTVSLGLIVAALATWHTGRLESRIWQQHAKVVEGRRELQHLSTQLVRAQEDERRIIARELHDEIGQALTAIDVQIAVAQHQEPSTEKAARALEDARAVTESAIQTVRDLSELLHPATLDDFGLPDTLTWYLQAFSKRTGIRAELVQDHLNGRMPAEVELCAYRVIQEALTNVVRHAEASACRVSLERRPGSLVMTIEDNGKGFDPAHAARDGRRGLGLVGIRQRVTELHGAFRLESAAAAGTRLITELPIPPVSSESVPLSVSPA